MSQSGSYESSNLGSTLVIATMFMVLLYTLFELNRHMRRMYLQRRTKKLIESTLVPPVPPRYVFGWVVSIYNIGDERDLLPMCGLDSYIMLEYTKVCLKIASFFSLVGLVIFVPVYASAGENVSADKIWNTYTISNVPDNPGAYQLWAPAFIMYIFSFYFCHLLNGLYREFVLKRLEYLKNGDPNTPQQTYYSIIVEGIPPSLRSAPKLRAFFEQLLPNQVHSAQLTLDLSELEKAVQQRRNVRDRLERAVALWKATGRRPTCWLSPKQQQLDPYEYPGHLPISTSSWPRVIMQFDAIDQLCLELAELNSTVELLQHKYFTQTDHPQVRDSEVLERSIGHMELGLKRISKTLFCKAGGGGSTTGGGGKQSVVASLLDYDGLQSMVLPPPDDIPNPILSTDPQSQSQSSSDPTTAAAAATTPPIPHAGVLKHAGQKLKQAAKGVLHSAVNIERHIELLTVGNYSAASTGFVTFTNRVAQSMAHQMLLSHEYSIMKAKPSPNPNDIIWKNVAIPEKQLSIRKDIAGVGLVFLAMFWSVLVAFISNISNLQSMQSDFPQLKKYTTTYWYEFVNSYLTSALLLICISLLPLIFDFIARSYEGVKLESEIQNSIMKRYFLYQLANVFVSVGLGSISGNIQEIIETPRSIFTILGANLPAFSMYFTNLLVVKAFTAVPLQLLRTWPLILHASVRLCLNESKCSWRDLRTGVFAPPQLVYGWIYPSLLMVLMIITTYSCIAPLLMPFGVFYYAIFYCMLKYQILFVYINKYQSGGYMWYAVFRRSMVALLAGVFVLICYMAIRRSFLSGPFYLLLPLPFCIIRFWTVCESHHKARSQVLSLEAANELDKQDGRKSMAEGGIGASPCDAFQTDLFISSALTEDQVLPAPYRRKDPLSNPDGSAVVESIMEDKPRGLSFSGPLREQGSSNNLQGSSSNENGDCERSGILQHPHSPSFDSLFYADDPEGTVELEVLLSEVYKRKRVDT